LQAVVGQLQLPYQGQVLDFESPFRRATMHDLVKDACGVDFEQFGSGDLEVRLDAWLGPGGQGVGVPC
jgi:lysyl-tRNA synthetase class 2